MAYTELTLMSRLDDLDFADDAALLSCNHQDMQYKLIRMAKISAKPSLSISNSKTKETRINATNADRQKSMKWKTLSTLAATSARIWTSN